MAKHAGDMAQLKSLIESNRIKNGHGVENLCNPETQTVQQQFANQQFLLNISLHACDVGNPVRPFNISKQWSHLVLDEFWKQGDQEKAVGLPVSFLCDRNTTNIPSSQIGFINGITLPLWGMLTEVMPGLQPFIDNAKQNIKEWEDIAIKEKEESSNN